MQTSRQVVLFILLLTTGIVAQAQKNETVENYIATYKELAIAEMQRTGVPASIKLAQGIHETMAGTSHLVLKSNNHFGIKCKSNWTGESVSHDDDARGECFRKYPSANDSYRDHSDFLKNSQRYATLFTLDPVDYQGWANGLKKAGYATNPKYPIVLIKLIEDYHLNDYTLIALGKMPAPEVVFAKAEEVKVAPVQTEEVAIATPVETRPAVNYPEGEFRINETKVVYARRGMSYFSIAQQYDVPLAKLFEFNELNQMETVPTDQLIFLQRKRKTGKSDMHIVKAGESLRDIAQEEAIRLETLLEYNWLKENEMPAIGERLSLRNRASGRPRLILKDNYSLAPSGF